MVTSLLRGFTLLVEEDLSPPPFPASLICRGNSWVRYIVVGLPPIYYLYARGKQTIIPNLSYILNLSFIYVKV